MSPANSFIQEVETQEAPSIIKHQKHGLHSRCLVGSAGNVRNDLMQHETMQMQFFNILCPSLTFSTVLIVYISVKKRAKRKKTTQNDRKKISLKKQILLPDLPSHSGFAFLHSIPRGLTNLVVAAGGSAGRWPVATWRSAGVDVRGREELCKWETTCSVVKFAIAIHCQDIHSISRSWKLLKAPPEAQVCNANVKETAIILGQTNGS